MIPAATGDGGRGVDIESAIRLAAAMLPADRAGRIVVAADGNETAGAVGAAVPELLARSLPLDFEPLAAMPPGEVLVARVEAGRNVRAGNSVPLTALIYAASPGPAALDIVRDGIAVATRTVALDAGWNRVDTVVPEVEGRTLVEVAISAPGDAEPGNNRDGAVIAPGPRRASSSFRPTGSGARSSPRPSTPRASRPRSSRPTVRRAISPAGSPSTWSSS